MIVDIQLILIFLLLGSVVGVMAGLLGIGGGGIMVPALSSIFLMQGIAVENVMHLSLGTSMACIITTSLSSLKAHHYKGAVIWSIVRLMSLGILLGTFMATFLATIASSIHLAIFFSVFMAYVSLSMIINKKPKPERGLVGRKGFFLAGSGIGAISALVSIGGGTLTVPFLYWQNIDLKKAIGTSAAIGFPISIAGTLGYIVNGWGASSIENYTLGFVYLPAVLFISLSSYFTAPLGVNLAHKLPIDSLKKIFAILLIILSMKMLLSILSS